MIPFVVIPFIYNKYVNAVKLTTVHAIINGHNRCNEFYPLIKAVHFLEHQPHFTSNTYKYVYFPFGFVTLSFLNVEMGTKLGTIHFSSFRKGDKTCKTN